MNNDTREKILDAVQQTVGDTGEVSVVSGIRGGLNIASMTLDKILHDVDVGADKAETYNHLASEILRDLVAGAPAEDAAFLIALVAWKCVSVLSDGLAKDEANEVIQ